VRTSPIDGIQLFVDWPLDGSLTDHFRVCGSVMDRFNQILALLVWITVSAHVQCVFVNFVMAGLHQVLIYCSAIVSIHSRDWTYLILVVMISFNQLLITVNAIYCIISFHSLRSVILINLFVVIRFNQILVRIDFILLSSFSRWFEDLCRLRH